MFIYINHYRLFVDNSHIIVTAVTLVTWYLPATTFVIYIIVERSHNIMYNIYVM